MLRITSFVTLVLALGLGACATFTGASGPAAVARLEKLHQADPASWEVNRALGIAYFESARYADARANLDRATRLNPNDGTTALYLGLTPKRKTNCPPQSVRIHPTLSTDVRVACAHNSRRGLPRLRVRS